MQDKVQTCLLVQYLSFLSADLHQALSYHLARQDTKTVLWSDCVCLWKSSADWPLQCCLRRPLALCKTFPLIVRPCPSHSIIWMCPPLIAIHFPALCIAFLILYMTREWIIFPFICTVEYSRQNYATRLDFFVYLRAARPPRIQRLLSPNYFFSLKTESTVLQCISYTLLYTGLTLVWGMWGAHLTLKCFHGIRWDVNIMCIQTSTCSHINKTVNCGGITIQEIGGKNI